MKTVSELTAAVAETTDRACEDIVALINAGGLVAAGSALDRLAGLGLASDDSRGQAVVIEILTAVLNGFDTDSCSTMCYEALALFGPERAMDAANLLFQVNFPDGNSDLSVLSDATVLCIAGLLHTAGNTEAAIQLLDKAANTRQTHVFVAAAHYACSRFLGLSEGIAGLWLGETGFDGSLADARARVEAQPFDMAAQRGFIRLLAEAELCQEALSALMTVLALPIGEADKAGLGLELAVLAVWLRSQGQADLLSARNCYYALAANPAITLEAETALRAIERTGGWASVDAATIAGTMNLFRQYREQHTPAYPMNGSKPHVDIVWLEVTNFCNQKCGFCPDMHREDSRQWLPLDQIKSLINELAETVSVGSMQLNAYGEPLLHPNIAEILAYIREKQLPWPTFFTTHGMTLVEKKLAQLSNNYPTGIAVSLHNDSQDSYTATRSAKIGDYDTLVSRVADLLAQMAREQAPSHVRLYQMVCNGFEDQKVDPIVRGAFPNSPERMARHVRKWEAIAARIAAELPPEQECWATTNSYHAIEQAFRNASHGDRDHLPILRWVDASGVVQTAFISARPVGTYANLLLEYDERWNVKRQIVNKSRCGFTGSPSLAIFATGKLGICCLDMNSTAVFGSLSDFDSLSNALQSQQANRIFAELSNGVATSRGCQICLASGEQLCGPKY